MGGAMRPNLFQWSKTSHGPYLCFRPLSVLAVLSVSEGGGLLFSRSSSVQAAQGTAIHVLRRNKPFARGPRARAYRVLLTPENGDCTEPQRSLRQIHPPLEDRA